MNRITAAAAAAAASAITATAEAAGRLAGLDLHVQADTSGLGWLAFDHRDHGAGNREVWGLGLHVTVSPLRASRPAA